MFHHPVLLLILNYHNEESNYNQPKRTGSAKPILFLFGRVLVIGRRNYTCLPDLSLICRALGEALARTARRHAGGSWSRGQAPDADLHRQPHRYWRMSLVGYWLPECPRPESCLTLRYFKLCDFRSLSSLVLMPGGQLNQSIERERERICENMCQSAQHVLA